MTDIDRQTALQQASVPTLLMCLAQITRDPKWLQEPFLPKRDISIFAEPSGGLSPEVQRTVRESLSAVLDELQAGTRTLPPLPTEAELMATVFPHPTLSEMMHEAVLDAYGRAIHF